MTDIKKYLERHSNSAELPDDFVHWRDIVIRGESIVIKDAVFMHSPEETMSQWAGVKAGLGTYSLSVKFVRDDRGHARNGIFRVNKRGSNPTRGENVGSVVVDFGTVGICDYDSYMEVVRKDEAEYHSYGGGLIDLMGENFAVEEFHGENIYFIKSGPGDGHFPVYALTENDAIVGLECDMIGE